MRQLLVIVIDDEVLLVPILDRFYEVGIGGATVLDSMGMGHVMAEHISIFARFADLTQDSERKNKTIFTIVENEEQLNKATEIVEEVVGDLDDPETGMWFVIPISKARGFKSALEE